MRFHRLIAERCPEEAWQQFVSPGRLQKAAELYDERSRRNQELSLLDCLQLSDKLQIVARNAELRSLTRFQSRRQINEATKMIEKLRNNLAHSQDIVSNDWDTIVVLSENIDNILDGPPGMPRESLK